MNMDDLLRKIREDIFKGNVEGVVDGVKQTQQEGYEISKILNEGLLRGMELVGRDFKANKIFIPEVLIAAKAVLAGLDILEPHFAKAGIQYKSKIVMGTVKGDLHDIGKNLVSMMLKGAGFEVFDLGIDVPKEKFIEEIKCKQISIVGMSCLISTALISMKETVQYLKKEIGQNEDIKVMVGGAAVTQDYAKSIGADAYGNNAADGVEIANKFLQGIK